MSVWVGRPPGVRPVLHLGRQCAQRADPFHVRIQLLNKKGPRPIMPAAMSHAGTMPAPAYNAGFRKYHHSSCWRTRQPAGTHASTQKRVGLEFDHAIAAPVVMPAHLPAYKKDGARRHRSLVVELEHVGLHLLEPRPLPWRHGVEIHLHDLHPGHHARESHFFRLGLGVGGLDL